MRKRPAVLGSAVMWWLLLLVGVGVVGCGGDAGEAEVDVLEREVEKAENAEVGEIIRSDEWAVTLAEPPERSKTVGTGPEIDRSLVGVVGTDNSAAGGGRRLGTLEAEGSWLILPLEIINQSGDLAMLSKKLLVVVDGDGTEYPVGEAMPHFLLINSDERWTSIQDNQLVEYVFETGLARQGPLVLDIPEGATALKLVMKGTDELIDLGF